VVRRHRACAASCRSATSRHGQTSATPRVRSETDRGRG
jgi:hypothetical protein